MGKPPKKSVSVAVSEDDSTPTVIVEPVLQKRTYNIDPAKRQERKERRQQKTNEYHRRSAQLRQLCGAVEFASNVETFTKSLDSLLSELGKRPGAIHCCWDHKDNLLKGRQCPREK
jgi:hypothetical protein